MGWLVLALQSVAGFPVTTPSFVETERGQRRLGQGRAELLRLAGVGLQSGMGMLRGGSSL